MKRFIPHALIVVLCVGGFLLWSYNEKPKTAHNRANGTPPSEQAMVEEDPTLNPQYLDGTAEIDIKWEPPTVNEGTWSQWRGPRQDGVSRDTKLLESWPKSGPKLAWSAPIGEG